MYPEPSTKPGILPNVKNDSRRTKRMTVSIRRKSRELALQSLYQSEMSDTPAAETFDILCRHFDVNRKAKGYAHELVKGTLSHKHDIDAQIEKYSRQWRIERMSIIDRNILRIAIFEMCHGEIVPANVVINEALEISKRFSTDDAASFINGILDAIAEKMDLQLNEQRGTE